MEERELASERIVKYEEMCGRNVTIIMAVFPLNGLVILQSKLEEWRSASSTTSLRKTEPESGRPCND